MAADGAPSAAPGGAPPREASGEFAPGHLLTWLLGGDGAPLAPPAALAGPTAMTPFSTVTMSSLPDGQPPMRPGGLFVAYASRRDGHDFVESAFANGATAALVARVPAALRRAVAGHTVAALDLRSGAQRGDAVAAAAGVIGAGRPLLVLVDRPLPALQGVAAWWRRRHRARVLAVAGAVGKTTTKELLANAAARRFRTLRTAGNFNNELGLPITLLGLTAAHEVAVLEIGISAVGEMAAFAALAAPDVVVMTRIVPEHMEFFGDLDTVEREEGRLVEAVSGAGFAVLNADDPRVDRMAGRTAARVLRFGERDGVEVRGGDVAQRGLDGLRFTLHYPATAGGPRPLRLALIGRHFLTAALGAAGAAFAAGCDWDDVVCGLEQAPQTQRLAPRYLPGGLTLLDDAYNASPDSARAALDVLATRPAAGGRRLALLGDMLELGAYAKVAHQEVGAHVPGRADLLITVGDLGREIARAARAAGVPPACVHECASAGEAVSLLRQLIRPGDTLLVKASHGVHLEVVVQALAEPRS